MKTTNLVFVEQLLILKNNFLYRFLTKVLNLVNFYIIFIIDELKSISIKNIFVWKSANFADSYWFLYNDKTTINTSYIIK